MMDWKTFICFMLFGFLTYILGYYEYKLKIYKKVESRLIKLDKIIKRLEKEEKNES